ncbi:hypothetical protein BGZ68_006373 [Mortierella alpina]|nr:hypothetical protein BGZ68_006373 [Mortierella alpina]
MSSKEILGEYTKVAVKLEHINATLQEMNAVDVAQLIDKIRTVERKMGLVYTLFKNQDQEEEDVDQNQQMVQEQEEQEQESEPHNNMQYNLGQQNAQGYRGQEQQEYHDQGYQQQQRSSQPYQEYAQQRSSGYPSYETNNNKQGSFYTGVNRPSQGQSSAAREEYQTSAGGGGGGGDRALLSLSRGYSGTRWTQAGRRDTEGHTNRPRFY